MEKSSSNVAENLKRIVDTMSQAAIKAGRSPSEIELMAVTKTQPPELVNEAIAAGVRLLGENRAQELCEKFDSYTKDGVDIHFIGHLQTNKIKSVVGKVSTVQSVDSLKVAREISKCSAEQGLVTGLLLEINIAGEQNKAGIPPEMAEELSHQIAALPGVKLRGLMAIPPIWRDNSENERYFARMNEILIDIKGKNIDNISMEILSMGMSDDYAFAIKHGSTLVRLGTALFGSRNR